MLPPQMVIYCIYIHIGNLPAAVRDVVTTDQVRGPDIVYQSINIISYD